MNEAATEPTIQIPENLLHPQSAPHISIKQEPVGNIRQRTSSFKIEGDEDAESAGGTKFP